MFRKITPAGANANNLIARYDAEGCCGDPVAKCQYSIVIPTANTVNGITIVQDGENVELTTGFPATGAANVRAAIRTALEAAGYENDDDDVPGVSSETSMSNTIYRVTGSVEVVSMRHNTSTNVNATALCTRMKKCVFAIDWGGSAGNTTVTINGVDATLASKTLAGNTAADVHTALIALANWPTTATADVVETATAFEIRVTDVHTATYAFGATVLTKDNCAMGYIAS